MLTEKDSKEFKDVNIIITHQKESDKKKKKKNALPTTTTTPVSAIPLVDSLLQPPLPSPSNSITGLTHRTPPKPPSIHSTHSQIQMRNSQDQNNTENFQSPVVNENSTLEVSPIPNGLTSQQSNAPPVQQQKDQQQPKQYQQLINGSNSNTSISPNKSRPKVPQLDLNNSNNTSKKSPNKNREEKM